MSRPSSPEAPYELTPEALRRRCDPAQFAFHSTDEISYTSAVIGQERALEALSFGLDMRGPGFNLFVMGPAGTGRRSILRRVVEQHAAHQATPDDWIYVNNFVQPGQPRAISLPAGMGRRFREDMERFNAELMARLPRAFETDQYAEARDQQEQELRALQQQEITTVDRAAQERGFVLVRSPSGLYIAPARNGTVLTPELFSQLPPEEREQLDAAYSELQDALDTALRRVRELERQIQEAIAKLDREVADFTIRPLLEELRETYKAQPEISEYLEEVRQDIIAHVADIRDGSEEESSADESSGSLLEVPPPLRYRVNLLVDHSHTEGAPVLLEDNPTYENLFGRIEYDVRYGSTVTDYTLIRPGALHRANGGYLILRAETLLEAPFAWAGLKRTLQSEVLRIERPDSQQLVNTVTPEPEPIPLRLKVILIGSPITYYTLYSYDEDFAELFKVRGDFSTEMERTPATELLYAHFIRARCEEEDLPPLAPEAVAQIVEFGARLVEDQDRLSTRFGAIADLTREATHWAHTAGHAVVQASDVVQALEQRKRRASQDAEELRRAILLGTIVVATDGTTIGQINGLTIFMAGELEYGMPTRITARVYIGRGNVLDIQREAHLSGPLHSKGVLTLTGYLGGQYGTQRPLNTEISLSFEQMYDEVEGDSASAAELYALLSALGDLPLRQDLAVTGAVDQFGRILPIGSVNEKIEGFFEICQARGLTGAQGVIIPAANARHLMLHEEVITAVRAGQFHIYPIETVDQGIALLTGREAGVRNARGEFPPGSVHSAVEARLREFARRNRTDGEEERPPTRAPEPQRRPAPRPRRTLWWALLSLVLATFLGRPKRRP